jgi:hypothetical protein
LGAKYWKWLAHKYAFYIFSVLEISFIYRIFFSGTIERCSYPEEKKVKNKSAQECINLPIIDGPFSTNIAVLEGAPLILL